MCISEYNLITCNTIVSCDKATEKSLRDSNEVKRSVKQTALGDLRYKTKNYYRCPNGMPADGASRGYRKAEWMVESGMFLLDIDDKDNLKNGKTWQEVWKAV